MPDANGKNDARNVSTTRGIKGGYAFCAPVGTPMPTSIDEPLNPAFKNAGFISSDGWKESLDSSSENIPDMNGDVVDTYDGETSESLAMKLLEMDTEPLSVQYGHDNVTENDKEIVVDHNWGKAGELLAWVLELVLKEGRRWRKCIPSAKRTELGDFEGSATSPAGRDVTLTYQTDANGSGCKDYIQKLPGEDAASKSLDDMTVDELKAYAAEHSIDLTGKTKKDDILAAIKAAEAAEAGEQGTE